jgi:oligopeptide/dipeptide ABC transporter ATP-binding protein
MADRSTLKQKVDAIMEKVGLSPKYARRYPHEFSGGQRQRIGIARALALNPKYIVCDEPVSALDVSIQAQIINLLQQLQEEGKISMLFISHDLNVVKHLSQRTAVMYLGKIVETAPTDVLNREAAHPYTQALLASKPSLNPKERSQRIILGGDVPSPMNPPAGCHFHPRCPKVMDHCKTEAPHAIELSPGHVVDCHLYTDPA